MMVSYKAIGSNIRVARKRMGLTQEKMSELCGMPPVHYGRLERGERRILLEQLALVAEKLKMNPDELLEGMTLNVCRTGKTDKRRIGIIIDCLCAGCSEEACSLMLDICAVIAEHDKF